MALIWKDRVKETSTTTGTGTYTLAGAATGFQSFSAIGNANTCYYCATDGTNWEVGLGTYTSAGGTLARTSVLASSNSGSAVNWAAGTKYVFTTVPAAGVRKNGPGGMSGLRVAYGSATTITIAAGECRDSTDTYDLTLAALVTVSIATAGAALGLDETALTATATTHGTATFEPSASIWSETAMTATARAATGTITGGGTTITGTGTLFLSELAVGDVIRSASKGAARVTAIASDTSLTIAAAFPDGNPGGQSFTVYENLTIWCDTAQAGDKRAVDTIDDDGTSVVVASAVTSSGAGRPMKIGVEIASRWFFPWVVYGSSGTTGILSTQRTRPYGVTGYTTAWRRVPCAAVNNSSGDLLYFEAWLGGPLRFVSWKSIGSTHRLLSAGAATSWTAVSAAVLGCPPTASMIALNMNLYDAKSDTANDTISFNARSIASASADGMCAASAATHAVGTPASDQSQGAPLPISSAGVFEYSFSIAGTLTNTPGYIDAIGFWEAS